MSKAVTVAELRSLCRSYTRAAVQTAGSIMAQPDCHPMARMKAAEFLMDRGWGKAAQLIEGEQGKHGPTEIKLVIINAPSRNETIIEQAQISSDNLDQTQISPGSCSASSATSANAQIEHKPSAHVEHKLVELVPIETKLP
jgi:hypothetical protein